MKRFGEGKNLEQANKAGPSTVVDNTLRDLYGGYSRTASKKRPPPLDVNREKPLDVNREKPLDVNREKPLDVNRKKPLDVNRKKPLKMRLFEGFSRKRGASPEPFSSLGDDTLKILYPYSENVLDPQGLGAILQESEAEKRIKSPGWDYNPTDEEKLERQIKTQVLRNNRLSHFIDKDLKSSIDDINADLIKLGKIQNMEIEAKPGEIDVLEKNLADTRYILSSKRAKLKGKQRSKIEDKIRDSESKIRDMRIYSTIEGLKKRKSEMEAYTDNADNQYRMNLEKLQGLIDRKQ